MIVHGHDIHWLSKVTGSNAGRGGIRRISTGHLKAGKPKRISDSIRPFVNLLEQYSNIVEIHPFKSTIGAAPNSE